MNEITISCLHATARPEMAVKCFHEWRSNSDRFDLVQWIFGVDESDKKTRSQMMDWVFSMNYPNVTIVTNYGHQTAVAALNKCAQVCMGDILVDVCDDVGCPPHWDTLMREIIPNPKEDNVFVKFGDGQISELCTHPVISRKRYDLQTYFMHPDFNGVQTFADEDATLRAKKEGVLIERMDIVFEHRHPAFGKGEWDDVYRRQSNSEVCQELLWKHHPEKRPK